MSSNWSKLVRQGVAQWQRAWSRSHRTRRKSPALLTISTEVGACELLENRQLLAAVNLTYNGKAYNTTVDGVNDNWGASVVYDSTFTRTIQVSTTNAGGVNWSVAAVDGFTPEAGYTLLPAANITSLSPSSGNLASSNATTGVVVTISTSGLTASTKYMGEILATDTDHVSDTNPIFFVFTTGTGSELQPVFSSLSAPTITYGTTMDTISGHIEAAGKFPVGDTVAITLNGVTQQATVDIAGNFSSDFSSNTLQATTYTVTFVDEATAVGYLPAPDASTTLQVNPAVLTINVPNQTMTYGSTPNPTYTYTGNVGGETPAFTGALATTATNFSPAGSDWPITQGTLAVSGNYSIGSIVFTNTPALNQSKLTITKAKATIVVTPYSVVFDNLAHTATGTATGVNGEDLSAGLNLAVTSHTNAGLYLDFCVYTDTTGNYQNSAVSVYNKITQAPVSITVTPYTVTFDGVSHTATGTAIAHNIWVGGVLSDVDLTQYLTLSTTTHKNASVYNDSWGFKEPSLNYQPASGKIVDTIGKADASVTVVGYSVTYDGKSHVATGSATGIGNVVLAGLNLNKTVHTNAGSWSDSWTFTDPTGNYNNASGTVPDSIAKATPTISVTGYNVTYDGVSHYASGKVTGVGGLAIGILNISGTAHSHAGVYSDTVTFTDTSGNYNNASKSVTDQINSAQTSLSLSATSVTTGTATGQVTLTALVTNTSNSAMIKEGAVTFNIDGADVAGTQTVYVAGNTTRYSLTVGLKGSTAGLNHTLVATYSDGVSPVNFLGSSSTKTINVKITDTTRTIPSPGSYGVAYWSSAAALTRLGTVSTGGLGYLNSQLASNSLYLRNGDGTLVSSFASVAAFQAWLTTNSGSSNYSAVLSTQLACLKLNVYSYYIYGTTWIDGTSLLPFSPTLGNGSGIVTVNSLIAVANSRLQSNGISLSLNLEASLATLFNSMNINSAVYYSSTKVTLS
ncbi:MAG: hypothetical protein JSS02_12995 [Planctomycetes bacterium]|nr:hypothetical protein [Planctomycetota bacterium]